MRVPSRVYNAHEQQVVRSTQTERTGTATVGDATAATAKEAHLKVSVSSEAKELAGANSIDMEKVERLRGLIEGGSFQIDPLRIAQRIVDQE